MKAFHGDQIMELYRALGQLGHLERMMKEQEESAAQPQVGETWWCKFPSNDDLQLNRVVQLGDIIKLWPIAHGIIGGAKFYRKPDVEFYRIEESAS